MFSSAPLDQKESADFEEKLQKYRCSITGQFFLEPVSTSECLHTFEKSAIEKWQEEHDECPLCRTPFNAKNQLHPESLLAIEALEEFLITHPEYQNERFFDLDLFIKILMKGESPRLRNMIKALHSSEKLLNDVSMDEKTEGLSPLYFLATNKVGIAALSHDGDLRKNITVANFNAIIEKGVDRGKSIAYLLAASEAGRQILIKDSSLCRKISYENLNKPISSGPDRGRSILYCLASTETGRKILAENLYLIGHMSEASLTTKMLDGNDRGRSAHEWLKNTDTGRQILNQRMLLSKQGKYIIDRGLLRQNPFENKNDFTESITVVSSVNDAFEAKTTFQNTLGRPMALSDATVSSLDIIQDSRFTDEFQTTVAPGEIVDALTTTFSDYQIPLGLINQLLRLSEYQIHIVISDDDSMKNQWNSIENRMHQLVNLLTYVTAREVRIEFLNRKDQIILTHSGQSFKTFKDQAHFQINKAFEKKPSGDVPLFAKMKTMNLTGDTAHYFYLNAEPTDLPPNKTLAMLLENRKSPEEHPMTWVDCNDGISDWSKGIYSSFTKVISCFDMMKQTVMRYQGPGFPFNEGMWLVCQLVAAMDQEAFGLLPGAPLNQKKLDNLMGRKLTKEEYRHYFDNHPYGRKKEYQAQIGRFVIEEQPLNLEQKRESSVSFSPSLRQS